MSLECTGVQSAYCRVARFDFAVHPQNAREHRGLVAAKASHHVRDEFLVQRTRLIGVWDHTGRLIQTLQTLGRRELIPCIPACLQVAKRRQLGHLLRAAARAGPPPFDKQRPAVGVFDELEAARWVGFGQCGTEK